MTLRISAILMAAFAATSLFAVSASSSTLRLQEIKREQTSLRATVSQQEAELARHTHSLRPENSLVVRNMAMKGVQESRVQIAQAQGKLSQLKAEEARLQLSIVNENKQNVDNSTAAAADAPLHLDEENTPSIQPKVEMRTVFELRDGSTIECLRYMEVDAQYILQLPSKQNRTLARDAVKDIRRVSASMQ
jgi:hypothetical protein